MDIFKEAEAIKGMMEIRGVSREKIAESLGITESTLSNKIRLLNLTNAERQIILNEGLTERHARALLPLKDKDLRLIALEKICKMKLTVAESEAVVELLKPNEEYKSEHFLCSNSTDDLTKFLEFLDKKIKTLKQKGVNIHKTTSDYGRKNYITIIIEE